MGLDCCSYCSLDQVHNSPGSLSCGRFAVGIEVVVDIALVVGLLGQHRRGVGWKGRRIYLCRTFWMSLG